jgi:hypothetical protein
MYIPRRALENKANPNNPYQLCPDEGGLCIANETSNDMRTPHGKARAPPAPDSIRQPIIN